MAWARQLQHWGAESATPAGTKRLWKAGGLLAGPSRQVRRRPRLRIAALHRKGTHRTGRRPARHCGAGATPRRPGGADTARRRGPRARCPCPSARALLGSRPERAGRGRPQGPPALFSCGSTRAGPPAAAGRRAGDGECAPRAPRRGCGRRWGAAVWVPGLEGDANDFQSGPNQCPRCSSKIPCGILLPHSSLLALKLIAYLLLCVLIFS